MNSVNNQNKWTRALWEPSAGVHTSKACVALGDVQGKNDHQLLLVDEDCVPSRLKLFKGLKTIAESVLADSPTGIVIFISDSGQTDTPCLAVAAGSSLLIYRNMKPYYRYNIPQLDILPAETEIWDRFREGQIQAAALYNGLKHLQMDHSMNQLSNQSQHFLTITSDQTREQFAEYVKEGMIPLSNIQISCIATMPRSGQSNAVDVIILGTEKCSIYFIDSQAYTVLHHIKICAVPVKILPTETMTTESAKQAGTYASPSAHPSAQASAKNIPRQDLVIRRIPKSA